MATKEKHKARSCYSYRTSRKEFQGHRIFRVHQDGATKTLKDRVKGFFNALKSKRFERRKTDT